MDFEEELLDYSDDPWQHDTVFTSTITTSFMNPVIIPSSLTAGACQPSLGRMEARVPYDPTRAFPTPKAHLPRSPLAVSPLLQDPGTTSLSPPHTFFASEPFLPASDPNFLLPDTGSSHLETSLQPLEQTWLADLEMQEVGWLRTLPDQTLQHSKTSPDCAELQNSKGFIASLLHLEDFHGSPPTTGSDNLNGDDRVNFLAGGSNERIPPIKKRKNKCLTPSGSPLNLVCGVNISLEEAGPMAEQTLVGKICGRNPTPDELDN